MTGPAETKSGGGVLSQGARVLTLAVVIGAVLLGLFSWLFEEIDLREVLTVASLVSVLAALALNWAWSRYRNKRGV